MKCISSNNYKYRAIYIVLIITGSILFVFSTNTLAVHDEVAECLAPFVGDKEKMPEALPELLKGVEYWKPTANEGNAMSQYCLAVIYQQISQHYYENIKGWMQLSADQNYLPALIELGTAYAHGNYGFPRDPKLAGNYMATAAMQGDALANLLMGVWQLNGLLPINEVEAYKNLRLAVEIAKSNNNKQILAFMEHMGQMHVINNLKEKLSKEDIKNAEKYVKEWKPIDN